MTGRGSQASPATMQVKGAGEGRAVRKQGRGAELGGGAGEGGVPGDWGAEPSNLVAGDILHQRCRESRKRNRLGRRGREQFQTTSTWA